MVVFSRETTKETGPRYVGPHVLAKFQEPSLVRYRTALTKFLWFITENSYVFSTPGELDDLVVEWKNRESPSRSDFEATLAAIETALPHYKHQLLWAKSVASAWGVAHQPKHTTPMCEGVNVYLSCFMSSLNHARLGAGMYLQKKLGLRPSELLGIERQDVMLPEDRGLNYQDAAVIGLGVRTGTKAKRAQTVQLQGKVPMALLRWLCSTSSPGERIVGYTYESYRRVLGRTSEAAGLADCAFTPHSPRSGFASDLIAQGAGFAKTRELGRWLSETSLRTYIDINSAAAIQVNLKTQKLNPAVAYCVANVMCFFPAAVPFLALDPVSSASPAVAAAGLDVGAREVSAAFAFDDGSGSCIGVGDLEEGEESRHPTGAEVQRGGRGRGSSAWSRGEAGGSQGRHQVAQGGRSRSGPGRSRGRGREAGDAPAR